jgi:hypothetical protein
MTQINRLQKLIDRLEKKVGTAFSFSYLSRYSDPVSSLLPYP